MDPISFTIKPISEILAFPTLFKVLGKLRIFANTIQKQMISAMVGSGFTFQRNILHQLFSAKPYRIIKGGDNELM